MSLLFLLALALFAIASVYQLGRWLRARLLRTQTGILDIAFIGQRRTRKIPGTAVVCGGSVAGLLAARVCNDHFEKVVVVEPEAWVTTDPAGRSTMAWDRSLKRSKIVQWRSLHGLQVFGFLALQRLFPGTLEEECKKSHIIIRAGDWRTSTWGHATLTPYFNYNDNLPKTMFSSRAGFETLLRRLTFSSSPEVTHVVGSVRGITPDKEGRDRIGSIIINENGGKTRTINATLVIDCTGPSSAGITWLSQSGYGQPAADRDILTLNKLQIAYDPKMHYSTLEFAVTPALSPRLPIPGGFVNSAAIYNCFTEPPKDHRNIYCQRIEGDRLYICCGAWGNVKLPTALEGVIQYARSMVVDKPIPEWFFDFLEMLHEVEDTMTCSTVRVAPCTYVRYHQAADLPNNFIALGDSVMRVNPVFGQGCTKAVLGALTLNTLLCSTPSTLPKDFAHRFFKAQAAKINHIWTGTKTTDYSYPTTVPVVGESLSHGAFLRWYIRRLHIVAFTDKWAGSALWHVKMFLTPPIDNLHPYLLMKVLWNWIAGPSYL